MRMFLLAISKDVGVVIVQQILRSNIFLALFLSIVDRYSHLVCNISTSTDFDMLNKNIYFLLRRLNPLRFSTNQKGTYYILNIFFSVFHVGLFIGEIIYT